MNPVAPSENVLARATRKVYWRLLPLLFICYMVAYIDRQNVAIAKLTMSKSMPAFDNAVIGFGTGMAFFWGYFLLEIPCSILINRWSARIWICRIMVTWGVIAALTAWVTTPWQFYAVRFCLGLAEAGFFPGVIAFLAHWFTGRDRARALSLFLIATPMAQIVSPKISNALIHIGTIELPNGQLMPDPSYAGMAGWQWVYLFWGLPAIVLGVVVWFFLSDRPRQAKWLTEEEKHALEGALERDSAARAPKRHLNLWQGLSNPKVLMLSMAYFCTVSASLGVELFLPSILDQWYKMKISDITWLVMLPPMLALCGQLFVGWNSDRTKERRLHATVPVALSLIALGLAPMTQGHLVASMMCFMVAAAGLKAYQPAFWSLPSLFLTETTVAAGSIALINSIGGLGGAYGQTMLGFVQKETGSFVGGLYFLCGSMAVYLVIVFCIGLGRRENKE